MSHSIKVEVSQTVENIEVSESTTTEEVNINIQEKPEQVEVEVVDIARGERGLQGLSAYQIWLQNGNTGTEADFLASLQKPTALPWFHYASSYQAGQETSITSGTVMEYTAGATTIFRFIPEPYIFSQDAFYQNFNGSILSNLLAKRQ